MVAPASPTPTVLAEATASTGEAVATSSVERDGTLDLPGMSTQTAACLM